MKLDRQTVLNVLREIQRLNPYIQFLRSPEGQIIFPRPPDAASNAQVYMSVDIPKVEEVEDREMQDELNVVINLDVDGVRLYDKGPMDTES